MAICWHASVKLLDTECVIAPERYSAQRNAHLIETIETIPLHQIARLIRSTVNPAQTDPTGEYVVLDTTHAVEGRIQFNSIPVKGVDVGSVKRPLQVGNIMISRLRTYLRQIALVDGDFVDRNKVPVVCSSEFYILEPLEDQTSIAFLVPYLLSDSVQKVFANAQEGGHHPRIHSNTLLNLRIPLKLVEVRGHLSERMIEAARVLRSAEAIFAEGAALVRSVDLGAAPQ